ETRATPDGPSTSHTSFFLRTRQLSRGDDYYGAGAWFSNSPARLSPQPQFPQKRARATDGSPHTPPSDFLPRGCCRLQRIEHLGRWSRGPGASVVPAVSPHSKAGVFR